MEEKEKLMDQSPGSDVIGTPADSFDSDAEDEDPDWKPDAKDISEGEEATNPAPNKTKKNFKGLWNNWTEHSVKGSYRYAGLCHYPPCAGQYHKNLILHHVDAHLFESYECPFSHLQPVPCELGEHVTAKQLHQHIITDHAELVCLHQGTKRGDESKDPPSLTEKVTAAIRLRPGQEIVDLEVCQNGYDRNQAVVVFSMESFNKPIMPATTHFEPPSIFKHGMERFENLYTQYAVNYLRLDNGHLAAAGNYPPDKRIHTYNMFNVVPMRPAFNRGFWKKMENYTRLLTRLYEDVDSITLPAYQKKINGSIQKREAAGCIPVPEMTHLVRIIKLYRQNESRRLIFKVPVQDYPFPTIFHAMSDFASVKDIIEVDLTDEFLQEIKSEDFVSRRPAVSQKEIEIIDLTCTDDEQMCDQETEEFIDPDVEAHCSTADNGQLFGRVTFPDGAQCFSKMCTASYTAYQSSSIRTHHNTVHLGCKKCPFCNICHFKNVPRHVKFSHASETGLAIENSDINQTDPFKNITVEGMLDKIQFNSVGRKIKHGNIVSFYDDDQHTPLETWHEVGKESALPSSELRCKNHAVFIGDVDQHQTTEVAIRYEGFVCGHLAAAGSHCQSEEAFNSTFFMSNIVPLYPEFNQGLLRQVEEYERQLAKVYQHVFVDTGTVYRKPSKLSVGGCTFNKPAQLYKIIICTIGETVNTMAYILPHTARHGQHFQQFRTTVEEVEKLTGRKMFSNFEPNYPYSTSRRVLKCNFCPKPFKTRQALADHRKKVHPEKYIYKCHISGCSAAFFKKASFLTHQKEVHGISTKTKPPVRRIVAKRVCMICGENFLDKRGLEDHLQIHMKGKLFACSYKGCEQTFSRLASLRNHRKFVHESLKDQLHQCPVEGCGRKYKKYIHVKLHMKYAHGSQANLRLPCRFAGCDETFKNPKSLQQHAMMFHKLSNVQNFKCQVEGCDKAYKRAILLKLHIKYDHRDPAAPRLPCSFDGCEKTFKNEKSLYEHERLSHKLSNAQKLQRQMKSLPCSFNGCGKTFKTVSSLHKHETFVHELSNVRNVKCQVEGCEKAYKTKDGLKKHMKFDHRNPSDPPLLCSFDGCGKTFKTISSLHRHKNDVHLLSNVRSVKCQVEGCDKAYKSKDALRNHMKFDHLNPSDPPLLCSFNGCGKTFRHSRALKDHQKNVHETSNDRNFKCQIEGCGKAYKGNNGLQRHMKFDHRNLSDPPLLCSFDGCEKTFRHSRALKEHQKNVHETSNDRNFKCQIEGCNKAYKAKKGLNWHMKLEHPSSPPLLSNLNGSGVTLPINNETNQETSNSSRFKCQVEGCEKTYKRRNELKRHTSYVHGNASDPPLLCTFAGCGQTFKNRKDLHDHMKTHGLSNVGTFKCHVKGCDKAYQFRYKLNYHIKHYHKNVDKPAIVCNYDGCGKIFKTPQKLLSHKKNVHQNATPFKCSVTGCGRTYKTQKNLKFHTKMRHGDSSSPPVKCTVCGKTFRRIESLRGHAKRLHQTTKGLMSSQELQ